MFNVDVDMNQLDPLSSKNMVPRFIGRDLTITKTRLAEKVS